MGAVSFSIDPKLLNWLSESAQLDVFVETGTFEGDSTETALPYFSELHTVELAVDLAERASDRFRDSNVVTVHQGSSPEVVSLLSKRFRGRPTVYWLDAHFCCRGSAGIGAQCPILDELRGIGSLDNTDIVLIDDARLFMAPPPDPFADEHWPTVQDIVRSLARLSADHELITVNDVLAFVPSVLTDGLRRFSQEIAVDWLLVMEGARRLHGMGALLREVARKLEETGWRAKGDATAVDEFAALNERIDRACKEAQIGEALLERGRAVTDSSPSPR